MGKYQVDLDQLDTVTKRIGGLTDFVAESLREIDERMATMQQNWSGDAADEQAAAHAEWVAAAEKIRGGVKKMQDAAAAAHTAYNDAVAENLRALGRA